MTSLAIFAMRHSPGGCLLAELVSPLAVRIHYFDVRPDRAGPAAR